MNRVKTISRDNDLDQTQNYSLSFIARSSPTESGGKKFPGHAYVVWAIVYENMSEKLEARGFYPPEFQEDFGKLILEFNGALLDEYRADAPSPNLEVSKLEVLVTEQMFTYSKQAISYWDQKETAYDFFVNNCVSFAGEVAKSLGLNVPTDTYTTPRSFLNDLIDSND